MPLFILHFGKMNTSNTDMAKKELENKLKSCVIDRDGKWILSSNDIQEILTLGAICLKKDLISSNEIGALSQLILSVLEGVRVDLYPIFSISKNEIPFMSQDLIDKAKERNDSYLPAPQSSSDQIEEWCKKIRYAKEELGCGRNKHTINGHVLYLPNSEDLFFSPEDLQEDPSGSSSYKLDHIFNTDKFKRLKSDVPMKLSINTMHEFLGAFAEMIGLQLPGDLLEASKKPDFDSMFGPYSSPMKIWQQMFRNITGFEGLILLPYVLHNGLCTFLRFGERTCFISDGKIWNDKKFAILLSPANPN